MQLNAGLMYMPEHNCYVSEQLTSTKKRRPVIEFFLIAQQLKRDQPFLLSYFYWRVMSSLPFFSTYSTYTLGICPNCLWGLLEEERCDSLLLGLFASSLYVCHRATVLFFSSFADERIRCAHSCLPVMKAEACVSTEPYSARFLHKRS